MKAKLILKRQYLLSEISFAEVVIWHVSTPLLGSTHDFKYRLAYVVNGQCVLRFDNESGKGDHAHINGQEKNYKFVSTDQLVTDFFTHIKQLESSS